MGPAQKDGAEEGLARHPRPQTGPQRNRSRPFPMVAESCPLGKYLLRLSGMTVRIHRHLFGTGGWQADRGFRVRTIISCAPDGGIRRSWVQKMLFGPATASLDSAADLADDDDAADGLAGVREPLPRPGGPGSSSAEAEVGPSADRIPDPVFSG